MIEQDIRKAFDDDSIAEALWTQYRSWVASSTFHEDQTENERMAKERLKQYLDREKAGEYTTSLDENGALVRTGGVVKVCLTLERPGATYLLIRPPKHQKRVDWKLPGGKVSCSDGVGRSQLAEKILETIRTSPPRLLDVDASTEGASFSEDPDHETKLAEFLHAALREMDEELDFPVVLQVPDTEHGRIWITPSGNPVDAIEDSCIVVIHSGLAEAHVNRNGREGDDKYPGIWRESTLVYVHATLNVRTPTFDVLAPVVSLDGRDSQRWIPLSPTVVEWLSEDPFRVLPDRLLHAVHAVERGSLYAPSALHVNSLLESIVATASDGSTQQSLERVLRRGKKRLETGEHSNDNLAQGTGKLTSKVERIAQNLVSIDNDDGYRIVRKGSTSTYPFTTGDALHQRADQLTLHRFGGRRHDQGEQPHGTRYRQTKRLPQRRVLDDYVAFQRIRAAKDSNLKDFDGPSALMKRLGGSEANLAKTLLSCFEKSLSNFEDIDWRGVRSGHFDAPDNARSSPFFISGSDLSKKVGGMFGTGGINWKATMARLDNAWEAMQSNACEACGVPAGEPCPPSALTAMKSSYSDNRLPRMNEKEDALVHAAWDHLVRDLIATIEEKQGHVAHSIYPIPPRSEVDAEVWKNGAAPTFSFENGPSLDEFTHENLTPEWVALKRQQRLPIRPFSCEKRLNASTSTLAWSSVLEGHLDPLGRRLGDDIRSGAAIMYLSGPTTEPPLIMQNLFRQMLEREHVAQKAAHNGWDRYGEQKLEPAWQDRLLWELIAPTAGTRLATVPIDGEGAGSGVQVPILRLEARDGSEDSRLNGIDASVCGRRLTHVLTPGGEAWTWTRNRSIGGSFEGVLPILSPDVPLGALRDMVVANGIGAAICIDAWSVIDAPETSPTYGSADAEWYISENMFEANEPKAHRTFGSFVAHLQNTAQLGIQARNVVHQRRILGVVTLDVLLDAMKQGLGNEL